MATVSSNRKAQLLEKIDEVKSAARGVNEAMVNDVGRKYRRLCNQAEEFDKLAKEVGIEFTRSLPVDLSDIEDNPEDEEFFFWKNELWYMSPYEDEMSSETSKTLNTLYSLPFSYEVKDAYNTDEKVQRARFALDEVRKIKEELEQL